MKNDLVIKEQATKISFFQNSSATQVIASFSTLA
jgi:hypothetical protein